MTLPTNDELRKLFRKRVQMKLDEDCTVEGVLIRWSDDGEVVYRGDDGEIWHAWPLLGIEEVPGDSSN